MILETSRLLLREMTWDDYPAICEILQDAQTMCAYEHAFSDDEAKQWMEKNFARYEKDGFGLWAVSLKDTGRVIGQCGLTTQHTPTGDMVEIGYLFNRAFWGSGYAIEAARGCKKYAFEVLKLPVVCSIIRESNLSSRNVAEKNGMRVAGEWLKHYYGIDMPHYIFSVKRK